MSYFWSFFVRVCAPLLGSVRPQLSLFAALAAGLWWFTAGCHVKSLPLPPTPSQTEVCSTMGECIRPSSFHNPTLSANKNVVQICRFSLSAAADGLTDGSGERRTSPFNGDAQSWNGIERLHSCAIVPQSLAVSATTFPTALSLCIAPRQGRLRKNIRYPSCSQRQKCCHLKRKKYINLVCSSCL